MYPTVLHIGSWEISSYGVALAVAMFVGIYLAKRRAVLEGLSPQIIESVSLWIIVAAILGARFLYTFVEHSDYYFAHPWKFFAFREGGLAFFGGLVFAVGASILFCFRKGISFWTLADVIAPSIALGLAIAKFGCFLVGCCYGSPCSLPWAVTFTHPEALAQPKGVPLHPVQLYEVLTNTAIFFAVVYFRRFRRTWGELFFFFLVLYTGLRSFLEIFRGDPGHLGTLTTAQFLSLPIGIVALAWWMYRRLKRAEPSV